MNENNSSDQKVQSTRRGNQNSNSMNETTTMNTKDSIRNADNTNANAAMNENNDIRSNINKSNSSHSGGACTLASTPLTTSKTTTTDNESDEAKQKSSSSSSSSSASSLLNHRNDSNYSPVCIPCKLPSDNNNGSIDNDDDNIDGLDLDVNTNHPEALTKEARIRSHQILHRLPSLPNDFKSINNIQNENGHATRTHASSTPNSKPSSPSPTKPSNHLSSHVINDVLQTPCPFITPSLLCSNQSPFIVLQELLDQKKKNTANNPIMNNNEEDMPSIPTATTTLNQFEFHIPSIVGTYIDTPIHLLHSIQYIEMDYFDDVSFDSFYDNHNNKNQQSSSSNNRVGRTNGGGFNMFHPPTGPFASRFQMYNNTQNNNEMNSILSSSLLSVLSRVYAMDLSIYDVSTITSSNRGINNTNSNDFDQDMEEDLQFEDINMNDILTLQDHELRERTRRVASRRRMGFMNYTNNNNNNSGVESNTSASSSVAKRNYHLLNRRIRRDKHYYEQLHNPNQQHHERTGSRDRSGSRSASASDGSANSPTNSRLRGINQVLHHFRTTIQQQQQQRQNPNNDNMDNLRRQYHHSISQVLDEDDHETFRTIDAQQLQHRQQEQFNSQEKEEEKEWIHVMYEERDETIAQLTQLILDEVPPSTNTSQSVATYTATYTTTHSINKTSDTDPSYERYKPSSNAQTHLFSKYNHIPKRVCQHPFRKNDIVWVCRTCQADETCVLCHHCFTNSNHVGHDVAFYHAQAGGCCDCGDEDAWDPKGFCGSHGRRLVSNGKNGGIDSAVIGSAGLLEKHVESKVKGLLRSCVEYIRLMACSVEAGYERANGGKILIDEYVDDKKANTLRRKPSLSGFKRKSDDSDGSNEDGTVNHDDFVRDQSRDMDMSFSERGSVDQLEQNNMSIASSTEQLTPMDVDVSAASPMTTNNEEFKFDPTAASTSKSRNSSSSCNNLKNAINEMMNIDSQSTGPNTQQIMFNPEYASMSKSRAQISRKDSLSSTSSQGKQIPISPTLSRAHQLGLLGSQQDGLYLVLHADDVNESKLVSSAIKELYQSYSIPNSLSPLPHLDDLFSTSSINVEVVTRFIPGLFQKKDSPVGDLIVWGPFELMEELGPVLSQCWKDGDATACSRFGALMLQKAKILQEKGLVVSIKTRVELCREVRALAVLEFLKMMSDCCDPLCHLVSLALGGSLDDESSSAYSENSSAQMGCLLEMLKNDLKLPRMVSKQMHDLLLKLLSEPNFKAALSNAYIDTYSDVTREYAHGVGILERSSYTLSVQFLNRVTYVQDLVRKKDLLGCVMRCLLNTLSVAKVTSEDDSLREEQIFGNERLNTLHSVLTDRRYTPCISDLKCVLNVPGTARLFASIPQLVPAASANPHFNEKHCVDAWIETLALTQNMDSHKWRSEKEGHVEIESRRWIGAFNASISLGSLFERLLMWKDDEKLPDNFEECPLALLNVVDLTQYLLCNGVAGWQKIECNDMNSVTKSGEKKPNEPMVLPVSNVAVAHGCADKVNILTFTQQSFWSFHLPLHRFLAACLREIVRRPSKSQSDINSITGLLKNLNSSAVDVLQTVELLNGLIEFPLIVLSRTSQIRSKLWRRNGQSMMDQVVHYSEPSFCKSLRDADLMVMQFGLIGNIFLSREKSFCHNTDVLHCANFISLLLHRFGIFDFVGFHVRSEEGNNICSSKSSHDVGRDNPATKDPDRLSSMLEEFLLLLIIFITELPPPQCSDGSKHIELAKQRLRREVVHRLVSGSKTHSDLSEVHHVLPLQDHVALSEEGMFVNPEDATGAALEAILVEVADCKSILGKSDKWQLQRWAWNEYDPAFFHISVQNHQDAAENRPSGMGATKEKGKVDSFPYAPFPPTAHSSFVRLRKDISADANIIAIIYRVLHIHCRSNIENDVFKTQMAYDNKVLSETLVGRVLHLLTLGVYAWDNSTANDSSGTFESAGMEIGSIFSTHPNAPTQQEWVERVFLRSPKEIMLSDEYTNEETMIELIDKLALDGGAKHFRVEDGAIRAGAAWLRESVVRISPKVATLVGQQSNEEKKSKESDLQRRKREAKERHMKQMQEKMANFMKQVEKDTVINTERDSSTFNSNKKENLDHASSCEKKPFFEISEESQTDSRNVQDSLKCAICGCGNDFQRQGNVQNKFQEEKNDDILALCGFLQSSVVLKGGCLIASKDKDAFVGNHISLCGHAVHTSCCESHLKDVFNRGGRQTDSLERGKRPEFRCPVCRRLSNCVIPLIDVNLDWMDNHQNPTVNHVSPTDNKNQKPILHDFLSNSKWWATRNISSLMWNGRCSFVPVNAKPINGKDGTNENLSHENLSHEFKTFCKKDLLKAWSAVMSAPSFMRRESITVSLDGVDNASVSTGVAGVWKRLLDHVADTSYKADLKRLGEERLFSDLGEFRHYLVEKDVFNRQNRQAGLETLSWPTCITNISQDSHSELTKEKLLSKLHLTFQTLTYSCCSEEVECVRQIVIDSMKNTNKANATFGVASVKCDGRLLVLPTSFQGCDSNEIFNGRIGRLRYFALCTMAATSPLSLEVVQLSFDLPTLDVPRDKEVKARAPIVYPLLCGHILTHVVAALCASCGQDLLRSSNSPAVKSANMFNKYLSNQGDNRQTVNTLDDCISFIQLGYVARVLQVSLGFIQENFSCSELEWNKWEKEVSFTIKMMLASNTLPDQLKGWDVTCCNLTLTALAANAANTPKQEKVDKPATDLKVDPHIVLEAFTLAKEQGSKYLFSACLIFQVLFPKASSTFKKLDSSSNEGDLLEALGISLDDFVSSTLVCQVVRHWYLTARPRLHMNELKKLLDCKRKFKTFDWPLEVHHLELVDLERNSPLFQGSFESTNDKPRITSLPHSYTDLYSEVGVLKPNCESVAVCLVCGEILDAEGKGECTKHASECGGGCGIFFLVQKCTTIFIHKDKAAFVMSPYVDSHGEVSHYRGRPLFLDKSRYHSLHEFWSSHLIREKVVSERFNSTIYNLIDNSFY